MNLDSLRRAFMPLFDRAALAVEKAGFAPDDAVIERTVRCAAHCSSGGSHATPAPARSIAEVHEWAAPADSLSDPARLFEVVMGHAGQERSTLDSKTVAITSLGVRAVLERAR